jgi:hypothetical protein
MTKADLIESAASKAALPRQGVEDIINQVRAETKSIFLGSVHFRFPTVRHERGEILRRERQFRLPPLELLSLRLARV